MGFKRFKYIATVENGTVYGIRTGKVTITATVIRRSIQVK